MKIKLHTITITISASDLPDEPIAKYVQDGDKVEIILGVHKFGKLSPEDKRAVLVHEATWAIHQFWDNYPNPPKPWGSAASKEEIDQWASSAAFNSLGNE